MSVGIRMQVNRNIPTVANYAALPAAALHNAEYYWVQASQGTAWLPGSLGGTYYPKGLYFSNGVTWSYMETPVQASQAEVDAGVVTDKFVTPETFANAAILNNFKWTLDMLSSLTGDIYPTEACSITSVTNVVNAPTTTILLNGAAYAFNDPIVSGDKVTISVSVAAVISLNFAI